MFAWLRGSKKNTYDETITLNTNKDKSVKLTNDILCKAYDGGSAGTKQIQKIGNLQASPEDPIGNSLDKSKKPMNWFIPVCMNWEKEKIHLEYGNIFVNF